MDTRLLAKIGAGTLLLIGAHFYIGKKDEQSSESISRRNEEFRKHQDVMAKMDRRDEKRKKWLGNEEVSSFRRFQSENLEQRDREIAWYASIAGVPRWSEDDILDGNNSPIRMMMDEEASKNPENFNYYDWVDYL